MNDVPFFPKIQDKHESAQKITYRTGYNQFVNLMPVIKIVELIGSSEKSWEEAVEEALREATKTVKNIVGLDVLGHKADVRDNKIVKYKAHVKIAFSVER